LPKVRSPKSPPELAGKIDRELFNQLLTVISPRFPLLFILHNTPSDFPIRCRHQTVNASGRGSPRSLQQFDDFRPDGIVILGNVGDVAHGRFLSSSYGRASRQNLIPIS
jgi:hypothetical protein